MSIKKSFSLIVLVVLSGMFFSCSEQTVKISGTFCGSGNKTVFLEQVTTGKNVIVDSVKTNRKGEFKFRYNIGNNTPVFVNLRLENRIIVLLVSPKETVNMVSLCNVANDYTITGSTGSELVKELNQNVIKTYHQIDSLYNLYNKYSDDTERRKILQEIAKKYVKQKQDHLKFIVINSNSLASIMALYQRMPNGVFIFDDKADFPYFKMVADSLTVKYPNSSHVKSLLKDVQQFENRNTMRDMIARAMDNNVANSPDIAMKDIHDKEHILSDLKGKITLLYFSDSNSQNSNMINRELVGMYEQVKDRGFEIYHVFLDRSKHDWINSVVVQKLPWITVSDLRGAESIAVKSYNITSVPANFLLDRDGDIIGKNLWGDDLMRKINESL